MKKNRPIKSKPVESPQRGVLVGRGKELDQIRACILAQRNLLIEGPVGVGKTRLALAMVEELGRPVFRVDGDSRYSEQKLSGWFDPPLVLKSGYTAKSFIPGPLVEAMQSGGVLFVNELNRLPEGVQNILLPAIDERIVTIPKLGTIHAKAGFSVIATQNPKEFVATSHLSEAILDRFELVVLDYQTEVEEVEIVSQFTDHPELPQLAVRLARLTRDHPRVRRGASVRAAQAIAELAEALLKTSPSGSFSQAFLSAALLALPTRIEIERDADANLSPHAEIRALIESWVGEVLQGQVRPDQKKKS